MKQPIERRSPAGPKDYFALAVTTCGVGYLPLAPGTWGSLVGVAIYFALNAILHVSVFAPFLRISEGRHAAVDAAVAIAFVAFTLLGIWAAGRSTELLGDKDPSEAVVDEVVGQLTTFLFIPFTDSWKLIFLGFLLFRLFDIWKPYPIDDLQNLPAGIGVCADDLLAGAYAGVCLAVFYAVSFYV